MQSHTASDAGSDDVIVLVDVDVHIDRVPVLRGLELTVAARETVGVVGANGSGKSTLLRVLATLLAPASGHGSVLGAALNSPQCAMVRPRIALVGHVAALYPRLSLRENLHFVARLTGHTQDAADAALAAVGLARAAGRPAEACSQGMQRRWELARVLMTEPLLLLLDEAHAGLDQSSLDLVETVVGRVRDRGGASVVVSHDQPRLGQMADRLVRIADGRAVPITADVAT